MSNFSLICFCIGLGVVVFNIFYKVEIRINKYDSRIYRWAKHLKCGAVRGHKYESGRCIYCGKRKLWRRTKE